MRPVHGGGWWALALAVVTPVLCAGPASADTTVEVSAGYAGGFVPGQEVPVRVRISADRLIRGNLEVAVGNLENSVPVSMPVEVPGGSQKEFLLTARAGLNQGPDVVARVRQDDRVAASGQTTVQAAIDTELVGLLPGALRGRPVPGATPLAVDAGTARFAAVGEAELAQAPASLGPLSTLAVDTDELVRLAPEARAGVLRWIEQGGRLLVDAPRGQPVPGLPDAWQPGTRGRAAAGLGEVVATGGAIAAGRWSGLVEPSAWGSLSGRFMGELPLAGSLASDAGLRTPELRWLVGFLALYVLVVGPAVFFAVRRRGRPELAWVAVPLVAILFATGSYVVGRDLRNGTQLVHASIVTSGAAGATATSYVGVFSRHGETARVGFPLGWSSGPFTNLGPTAASPSVIDRTPDGLDARLPLDAGQFGIVHASGPAAGAVGLDLHVALDGAGTIVGTVGNPSALRMEEVGVFASSAALVVGSLEPGEQRDFTLEAAAGGPGRMDGIEFRMWPGLRPGVGAGAADYSLWQVALQGSPVSLVTSGAVVAAGWTRDFTPAVRIDGRAGHPAGRTLVIARQPVAAGANVPLTGAVRRDVMRDPFNRFAPGGRAGSSVIRFVLPQGADLSKLVLQNPLGSAEVWEDGTWRTLPCDGGICRPQAGGPEAVVACSSNGPCPIGPPVAFRGIDFPLPPTAVRDGVVYVRVPGPATLPPGVQLAVGRAA